MGAEPVELPARFAALAPFVADWGDLETQDERYLKRQSLSIDRLQQYHRSVAPLLDAIFAHLDSFPFGEELPASEALLLRVVMAMTEVAQAVENYGCPGVPHAATGHSVPVAGLYCA